MNERRIFVFDTTLRDGEQSPGASLTVEEKLKIAHQLKKLGVDIIEAGFPIASPGDFEAVKKIAEEIGSSDGPTIAGLARAIEKDIEAAAEALKPAKKHRIHTFIATSDIHIKYKLRSTREEVLEKARWAVEFARKFTDDVEFSPEDATRSDKNFLFKVIETAIKAGAKTINIPDTVGYTTPFEFYELIREIIEKVPGADEIVLSVHCHNDLGLATANSLAAIRAGASQVEVTINGIGERAGNAALEEVVMALWTRKDYFKAYTNINTKEIYPTSRLVSTLTGFVVQPNKAIVGRNAFAHESGIHQDGILKSRLTYEIIEPQVIGLEESKIVLGKHSGRHAIKARLEKLGYHLSEEEVDKVFLKFKKLADVKKEIYDEDLIALVEDRKPEEMTYQLLYFNTMAGSATIPTSTVKIKIKDDEVVAAEWGDGPVDAIYKAIEKAVSQKGELLDFNLRAITRGKDAQGEVTIKLKLEDGTVVIGRGISTDILEASARAYIDALNRYEIRKNYNEKIKKEGI